MNNQVDVGETVPMNAVGNDTNDSPMADELTVTQATEIFGGWGPFQLKMILLTSLFGILSPIHNIGIVLYAPKLDFACKRPPEYQNSTELYKCRSYDDPNSPCPEYVYDMGVFQKTATDEWNLVCDRSWVIPAASSAYQVGFLTSSIIVGLLSDRFGRCRVHWILVSLELLVILSQALSISFHQFLVSRFLLGLTSSGRSMCGFIMTIEWVGDKYRNRTTIITTNIGAWAWLLIPGLIYLIPHFRHMNFVLAGLHLAMMLMLPMLKESPRWLLTNGHYDKARKLIVDVAKYQGKCNDEMLVNCKVDSLLRHYKRSADGETNRRENYFDIFKQKQLAKYMLLQYVTWFVVSFVYYGFTINVGDLGGNIFLNVLYLAISRIARACIFSFGVKQLSRKLLLLLPFVIGSLAFFTIAATQWVESLSFKISVAMFGMSFIGIAFGTVYLYASEIFPTSVRQIGIGSCSVAARFGSISAPFVGQLSQYTHVGVTMGLFGALSAIASFVTVFLPETKNKRIPDSVARG